MRRPLLGLLSLTLLTACGGSESEPDASASAPQAPVDLRANLHTASTQSRATLAAAPDGRVVVAWDSRRQEEGSDGVYARVFGANGLPLSDEFHVNQTVANAQHRSSVAVAPDGSAWFVWESMHTDGSGAGVVARHFASDADGALQPSGPEVAVNEVRDGDQAQAVVAAGADGRALVVYAAQLASEVPGVARFELRARSLFGPAAATAVGAGVRSTEHLPRAGDEHVLTDPASGSDRLPSLTAAGDGYVLTWARHHAAEQSGVWALLLDADGAARGPAFRLADEVDCIEPSVSAAADGSFVAAWMAPRADGYAVQARRFAADGMPRGAVRTLATPDEGWLSGVAVACAPDGRHAVAFNRDHGGERGEDVFVDRFAADGAPLGRQVATAHRAGRQALQPSIGATRAVWTADGSLALAWEGDAGLEDASAAHLSLLDASTSRTPDEAARLAQASLAGRPAVFGQLEEQLAIPPIWDPNWVPQERLLFPSAASGDFGFEAVPGTGWTPPDPEMAVGPDRIGVIVNGRIALFDRSGNEQWRDEIEDSFGFWGSLGATGFVFDPEICWDPHDQRFVAMACERSSNSRSFFLLAVSKDATPDDANDWHKYRIDVTATAGNDIDSPNLCVSRGMLLLTADFFGPDKYLLHIIDKASIYGGGAPNSVEELITGSSQQSMGIPVVYDDTDTLYVLQSTENSTNNTVIFHAITDPFTAYSRVTHTLSVDSYRYPNQPPQRGSTSRPFLFEPRFWSVAQRSGSLWAVHHVNSNRARVRWYQFDLNGWPGSGSTPTERQSGEIDLGGDIHTYFPSIHVDGQDNAAISFARSAPNEYISFGRATRGAGDPLGNFRPAQVVQVSANAHTSGRWGDYSGTQADPLADGVFWGHHEFTNGSTSSWRTWVARYDLRPDGLLLAETPLTGGASNTLSVTGATANARVYFVYGLGGTALTEVPALQATLSLANPVLAGSARADASGNASLTKSVSAAVTGTRVWLQAAEVGETSNWYSTVIQ